VLPSGSGWTANGSDGVAELDRRITLETDDSALVDITFEGAPDNGAPETPDFRTMPRFETAETRYSFFEAPAGRRLWKVRSDGPVHVIEEICD
jgi:hypothetical protein